jgi:hypothetical protein
VTPINAPRRGTRALTRPSGGPHVTREVGQTCHNGRPDLRVPTLPRQPDRWATLS